MIIFIEDFCQCHQFILKDNSSTDCRQVICAKGLCHPVWNPNFKDRNVHHLSSAPFDWHTDALAVHWTYPDPEEFADEQALLDSISMFASIGKYVLRKAEHRLEEELT